MNNTDAVPAEEFLFGRLSTPAGREQEGREEQQGFFDLANLEPLDPLPRQPILLRFRSGVDVGLERLLVFWTYDGTIPVWNEQLQVQNKTQVAFGQSLPPVWNTPAWGYVQDWELVIPGQEEGTLLRYAAVGVDASGRTIPCPWLKAGRHGTPHIAALTVDWLQPPDWLREAIVYQVFVDRFAPSPGTEFLPNGDLNTRLGGTLLGLVNQLDDIASLGVNTLWLTPIFQSPNYHGYCTSDFFQVEPSLGGEEAWLELVEACRKRKLRLVLDFVANHVSDQHPAFIQARASPDAPTKEWFRFSRWPDKYEGFFDQPHQPELDAELEPVRDHLIQAACYWLRKGCDGFRLDYAHGLSHGFWSQFRNVTRAVAPDSACFGEITSTPQIVRSYSGRLDGALDFALCEILREAFARDRMALSVFDRVIQRHMDYFQDRMVLPSFLDNHDMNRFLIAAGGDLRRMKLAALVQFLLPGPPIIYYGTEIGLSQNKPLGHLEEARLPMPPRSQWDIPLREYYSQLIALRREAHPSTQRLRLLWVEDETKSAAWRIGPFELLINCGNERSIKTKASQILLASCKPLPKLEQGQLLLSAWSGVLLRYNEGS